MLDFYFPWSPEIEQLIFESGLSYDDAVRLYNAFTATFYGFDSVVAKVVTTRRMCGRCRAKLVKELVARLKEIHTSREDNEEESSTLYSDAVD